MTGTYDATFRITTNIDISPLETCRIKYKAIKRNTFDLIEEEFLRATRLRIDVRSIDDSAFAAIKEDWCRFDRRLPIEWEDEVVPTLRKSHPRALDMAIWREGMLCGLAAVRLSDAKTWLSLSFLEGHPNAGHPLKNKIGPTVVAAMDIYATLIEQHDAKGRKPALRIMRPLPNSVDRYRELGYSEGQTGKGNGKKYLYILPRQGGES